MESASTFDVGAALNTLIARSGKQKLALANHLGVSEQAVQKWIRQGTIAREHIRRICLFLDCSADELLGIVPIGATSPDQSQAVRLDSDMIAEAAKALRLRFEKAGGYSVEKDPEQFAIAYEIRAGMTNAYESPEVYQLVIQHADLTPQGASKNERSDGTPGHGGTKQETRRNPKRKA